MTGSHAASAAPTAAPTAASTGPVSVRARPGLRIALLSAAATILLLGAVAAGVYGYLAIGR
jgi:hypothetical protein